MMVMKVTTEGKGGLAVLAAKDAGMLVDVMLTASNASQSAGGELLTVCPQ